MQGGEIRTFNEIQIARTGKSLSEIFPKELEQLGEVMGNVVAGENMCEIGKLQIDSFLASLSRESPDIFTEEKSRLFNVNLVMSLARPDDKSFNDILAHLIRSYNQIVNRKTSLICDDDS